MVDTKSRCFVTKRKTGIFFTLSCNLKDLLLRGTMFGLVLWCCHFRHYRELLVTLVGLRSFIDQLLKSCWLIFISVMFQVIKKSSYCNKLTNSWAVSCRWLCNFICGKYIEKNSVCMKKYKKEWNTIFKNLNCIMPLYMKFI